MSSKQALLRQKRDDLKSVLNWVIPKTDPQYDVFMDLKIRREMDLRVEIANLERELERHGEI